MSDELIEIHADVYVRPSWVPWGLTLRTPGNHMIGPAILAHDMVSCYLREHPDIAAQYRPDQTGLMKYNDVLCLAEREYGRVIV